jgi:protein phosphatase
MMPDPKADCFGASDMGRVRTRNEDQFLLAELQRSMLVAAASLTHEDRTRLFGRVQGHLLLVADGMGGAAEGERASRIAASSVTSYVLNTMHWFLGFDDAHLQELKQELITGLLRCQRSIEKFTSEHPSARGMGTTLTLAYVIWPRAYIVHVGDSRCYLYRDGWLEQVTKDHTVAQQLRETGVDVSAQSRLGHVLWNVIGGESSELEPEVYRLELKERDTLLLCTDGLTKHVRDSAIAELVSLDLPAEETCRRAIAAANEGGGSDNTTVVVCRFPEAPSGASPQPAHAAVPLRKEMEVTS